jgi:hypothetical protein
MNGILLEGEVISRRTKYMSAMLDTAASFEIIYDDLQQFEEQGQAKLSMKALVICLVMQKDWWPLRPVLR